MRRNRPRILHLSGLVIGEGLHAILLTLGLLVFTVLLLCGFDPVKTAQFVHNFAGRLIEAEPSRAYAFAWFAGTVLFTAACFVVVVRVIDRLWERRQA